MTEWIKHNGGPQPVGDDVWVEAEYPVIDPAADPLFDGPCYAIHMAMADEHLWGDAFYYRILNQHLIDAKQAEIDRLREKLAAGLDGARLAGIRLGLEAAAKEVVEWDCNPDVHAIASAIRTLDPTTIANRRVYNGQSTWD